MKQLPIEFFRQNGQYVSPVSDCGIYAVVNPSNEIYIGQSYKLMNKIRAYKKKHIAHGLLKKSLFIYGRKNHRFFLVKELSKEDTQETLWYWEKFYIKKYKEAGFTMLNCNGGGAGSYLAGSIMSKYSPTTLSLYKGKTKQKYGYKLPYPTRPIQSSQSL